MAFETDAPQHFDDLTADQRRLALKQLEKSRGLIVMASTDPAVETMRIPIYWPFVGADVLKRDMAEALTGIPADENAELRTKTLASVFREIWHELNGELVAQDQETRDSLIVWGNLLIEQIQKAVVAVKIASEARPFNEKPPPADIAGPPQTRDFGRIGQDCALITSTGQPLVDRDIDQGANVSSTDRRMWRRP
jgi:hypothetical protein